MELKTKRNIVAGVLIVGVVGLVGYLGKQFHTLYNSCYAVVGAVIHKFSLDDVRITLMVRIENKSDLTVKLTKQHYNVYINNMQVASFYNENPVKLVSHSTQTLPIDVNFNPSDLLKKGITNITDLLGDKSKLIIGIRGSLTITSGIAKVDNLPVETSMSLKEMMTVNPATTDICKDFDKKNKKKRKKKRS